MSKIVIRAFGGMLPIMDSNLLPDSNAEQAINTWLYSGALQGFREPVPIHTLDNPSARTVFRVPKGAADVAAISESFWLEFEDANTSVVRSPISDIDDPRFYWASKSEAPHYTTKSRLQAGDPPLLLGIPQPSIAPGVTSSGGVSPTDESRAYVYTWVSQYGEEGPPSPPTLHTGQIDDTWHITMTAPGPGDTTDRALAYTNIYRTVTAADGTAQYYFVVQLPIATLSYDDTAASEDVALNNPLLSTFWTGPPSDLEGLCSLPNGMIAAWRGQELWYCEPFRPHAWPVQYQTSVDFNIIGMAALDQMLVVGTENVAFSATGVHPSSVTTRIITGSEPCLSQGSFVVTPNGVLYACPNGLMNCTSGGATNVTRSFISTDKWNQLLNLKQLNAALMNGAYYCYSGVLLPVFQANAFQNNAFQIEVPPASVDGALIELGDQRVAVSILHDADMTSKVIQDVWTAEVLLVRDGQVFLHSLVQGIKGAYDWKSKLFQLTLPQNYGAMKIVCSPIAEPPAGTVKVYAGGVLRLTRPIPVGSKPFRLPSGFKADNLQVEISGNLSISQVEIASTMQELSQV